MWRNKKEIEARFEMIYIQFTENSLIFTYDELFLSGLKFGELG